MFHPALIILAVGFLVSVLIVTFYKPEFSQDDVLDDVVSKNETKRFSFQCPHCAEWHALFWEHIQWDTEGNEDPFWKCPTCDFSVSEKSVKTALQDGEWRGAAKVYQFPPMSALYTPWIKWSEVRDDFLAAKYKAKHDDVEALRKFVTDRLGKPWAPENSESHELNKPQTGAKR